MGLVKDYLDRFTTLPIADAFVTRLLAEMIVYNTGLDRWRKELELLLGCLNSSQ